MKLKTRLSGTERELSLTFDSSGAIADVDARHYEVEVRELTSGRYLLVAGPNIYKCRVGRKRDPRNSFEVVVRGNAYDITLVDPKRLRSGQSSGAHDHGVAEIVSPMPGKIVRILVEAGARVEAGQGIIVVEAMKMQNEMKAPKAGVVVSINAEAGATVSAGDVLAVIE